MSLHSQTAHGTVVGTPKYSWSLRNDATNTAQGAVANGRLNPIVMCGPPGCRCQEPAWFGGQLATGPVSTYYVYMNVTLALDEQLVARAREVAGREGLSLNEMIRRHLEVVAGVRQGPLVADEMRRLWASFPGHSGGQRFNRADAYEGRL